MRSTRCSFSPFRGFAACISFSSTASCALDEEGAAVTCGWGSAHTRHQLVSHHCRLLNERHAIKSNEKKTSEFNVKRRKASSLRLRCSSHVWRATYFFAIYVVLVVLFMGTYYDMAAKARGLNFSSSKALKKTTAYKAFVRVFLSNPATSLRPPSPLSCTRRMICAFAVV